MTILRSAIRSRSRLRTLTISVPLLVRVAVAFCVMTQFVVNSSSVGAEDNAVPLPKAGLARTTANTVVLSTEDSQISGSMRKIRLGSLARELTRQAILIAARDELNLQTLDASLGEVSFVQESPQEYPFQVDITMAAATDGGSDAGVIFHLSRAEPSGRWFKWSSSPVQLPPKPGLDVLTEAAESLSRGDFVTALKEAGLAQATEHPEKPLTVPKSFEHHLDTVAQFAVIKGLHSERLVKGETIENLGALVRAYSNLADLVEFHWSPASKVFKARALIYAHRMLAKYGKTAVTLSHRAYAWTLAGNYALAIEDAKAARAIASKELPAWLPLMEAVCEYKPKVLEKAKGRLHELGLYLRMKLAEPDYDQLKSIEAVEQFLKLNPACSRAIERMCETRSLGMLRAATEGAADQSWISVYDRMFQLPQFPLKPKEIAARMRKVGQPDPADEYQARVELVEQLRQVTAAGDHSEPSWSLLGELISDASFVQTWRVLDVESNWLGLPREQRKETIDLVKPLIAGHRFAPFLRTFAGDKVATAKAFEQLDKSTEPFQYEMQCAPIMFSAARNNSEFHHHFYAHIEAHWDKVYSDVLRAVKSGGPDWSRDGWTLLPQICPDEPRSITRTLHLTKTFTEEQAQEWERKYADNNFIMLELGRKYETLYRSDDAIRCWKRSIEARPTHDAYAKLAQEYKEHDQLEDARKTMEAAIKLPSYGLEEGGVQKNLANLLMEQGDYRAAMPHAMAAAGTYSAWGLRLAARCAEGLKELEQADELYQADAERYGTGSGENWYFMEVRMGRPISEDARTMAEQHWGSFGKALNRDQLWSRIVGYLIDGDNGPALATLTEPQNKPGLNIHLMLFSSLLAEKRGDTAARDAIYQEMDARFQVVTSAERLVSLFRFAVRDPAKFHWNRHSFHELVDGMGADDVAFAYYTAGEFLGLHGEKELSEEYLQCAATSFDVNRRTCVLANVALRAKKIPVGETRLHQHPDDRYPGIKLVWKATVARRERKFDQAQTYLKEAMECLPDFVGALLARGKLSEALGRPGDALKDYDAIVQINPESELGHSNLARLLACSDKAELRNGAEALKHAERYAELHLHRAGYKYWILAAAHAEAGNFDQAIENQEIATKMSPRNTQWARQLALYREKKPYRLPKVVAADVAEEEEQ